MTEPTAKVAPDVTFFSAQLLKLHLLCIKQELPAFVFIMTLLGYSIGRATLNAAPTRFTSIKETVG